MRTVVKGKSKEVIIERGGPVRIIGESINPTRRRSLEQSLMKGDFAPMLGLAQAQLNAGAEILDINVGYPGVDDVYLLPEAVMAVQAGFDVPVSIDSPNYFAVEAALKVTLGKPIINSVNGEIASMERLLPLAAEYKAAIIGLVMDENGIPKDAESRFRIAEKIAEKAAIAGIAEEDLIIDPLVMAVSADPGSAITALETMLLVKERLGLNITQGASNVSFGLPDRDTLNAVFIALSIYNGLTCTIANPVKATAAVRAADLLLGNDEFAVRFIEQYQARK